MPHFSELKSLLEKHFPEVLLDERLQQFETAFDAYIEWNARINVISRKDIDNLAERHFLHSLAIAKSIRFLPGTKLLDAGTGGGFPGVPLAILFPESEFHLVDSREKKIKVVQEVVHATGLKNVHSTVQRVEQLTDQYDFVLSRAVASLDEFIPWVRKRIHCRSRHALSNGILYLRGGGVAEELRSMVRQEPPRWHATPLSEMFEGEYFESKFLVHLSFCPPVKGAAILDSADLLQHMRAYVQAMAQAPDMTGMDFALEHGWVKQEEWDEAKAKLIAAQQAADPHMKAIRGIQAKALLEFEAWLLAQARKIHFDKKPDKTRFLKALAQFIAREPESLAPRYLLDKLCQAAQQ